MAERRRRAELAIAWAASFACAPSSDRAIVFPDALFESPFVSAVVLVQSGSELDSPVLRAWAVDLENPAPLLMDVEATEITIRVFAYPDPLSTWNLEPGLLAGPTGVDNGSALPRPRAGFVATVGVDDALEPVDWLAQPAPADMTKVPLRIPAIDACAWVAPEAQAVPGFETSSLNGWAELEDGRFLISGHRGFDVEPIDLDGFLGRLGDFETYENFLADLPGRSIGRISSSPFGFFATTSRGELVTIDVAAGTATTAQVLEDEDAFIRWTLSVGADGLAIIFTRPESNAEPTRPASWIDLQTRALRAVDAPEEFQRVAVSNASSVLAASGGTIYHYDGRTWSREREGPVVRDIDAIEGNRFAVIAVGGKLAIREADGTWTDWPLDFPGGLVPNFVRRLPGERWLIASDAGLATVWVDDRWCQVLTGVARTFLSAELSLNRQSVWLGAYSDSPEHQARVAHIRVERAPLAGP